MVATFSDSIERVVELDDVAAEATIVDADRGTGNLIDRIVADGNLFGHGDDDAGGLLADDAQVVHQVVVDSAPCGVVGRLGAGGEVDLILRQRATVLDGRTAHGAQVADHADGTLAEPRELAAQYAYAAIVSADKDAVGYLRWFC